MAIQPGPGFKGLWLRNTLTGEKDAFNPIDAKNVRMYVCGPTVYDLAHIGNARPLIVFDVLYRLLRHLYGPEHVTYVRNITDVDDKINARAAEEYPDLPLNEAIGKVTETTEKQFHEDVKALGCLEPTVEPRATEHIGEMKAMIETLVEKDFAYVEQDHVLFSVAKMKDYGKLSNRSLDDMIAGARVDVAPYKRDPMDFVLWKPSNQEARSEATGKQEQEARSAATGKTTGGEPAWPSPWGEGRPGWHLECSAMADRWLWDAARPSLSEAGLARPHQFDIHGGGVDLMFPHHENEIAQSRSAHGTDVLANYWLHNGFLQVEGEKMAKSAGNFVTVRDLLRDWHGIAWRGVVLRWTMLKTHYRQPIDWTYQAVRESAFELEAIQRWIKTEEPAIEPSRSAANPVLDALTDDLNTPQAIARVHTLVKRLKDGATSGNPDNAAFEQLSVGMDLLGIDLSGYDANRMFASKQSVDTARIASCVAARAAARKAKDFAEADRIRDKLDAMGIALKDSKDPETGELKTTWEVKR